MSTGNMGLYILQAPFLTVVTPPPENVMVLYTSKIQHFDLTVPCEDQFHLQRFCCNA